MTTGIQVTRNRPVIKPAAFDSWLTVGITEGDANNQLGIAGLTQQLKKWNEKTGIDATDGSVFWMDPNKSTAKGQGKPIVLAQLTVPSSYKGSAKMGIIGQVQNGKAGEKWRDDVCGEKCVCVCVLM